ncbi:MAG: DUF885 family protein [Planctomycetota bacterium]|jgi:hypothetical protein
MLLSAVLVLAPLLPQQQPAATTVERIKQYQADRDALARTWGLPLSEVGHRRRMQLAQDWLQDLDRVPFEDLKPRAQIDWLLLKGRVAHDAAVLERAGARLAEIGYWVESALPLVELLEQRAARGTVAPEQVAALLAATSHSLEDFMESYAAEPAAAETAEPNVEPEPIDRPQLSPTLARHAARQIDALRRSLRDWFHDHDGYDPMFAWWCRAPWEQLEGKLEDYASFLREDVGGIDPEDEDALLGDPIGRDALLEELAFERIAYTPEELIAIAEREFAWCQEERRKAADAMGLEGDWKAAQEAVKAVHMPPGRQPEMIERLAEEAVEFLEQRDLITIPDLAKEVWRMDMMSLERQKFTPYFTGGEVISIGYPLEQMEHDDKIMSMRGNNEHYSKATVHHELIPGHHLQGYMSSRWNPHRRAFYTPFLVEGWALYWELRLWDMDFADGPEDRIGMLFWRSHRCARIIFSLKYHLGDWTAEQCVDFLVDQVGHERRNATAEVRRSIQGGYGPLYQCAYMTGGLQLRALQREVVTPGGAWSERQFHDAILRAGPIPIELLRAELLGLELSRDLPVEWRFDGE